MATVAGRKLGLGFDWLIGLLIGVFFLFAPLSDLGSGTEVIETLFFSYSGLNLALGYLRILKSRSI